MNKWICRTCYTPCILLTESEVTPFGGTCGGKREWQRFSSMDIYNKETSIGYCKECPNMCYLVIPSDCGVKERVCPYETTVAKWRPNEE